jgi:SAM-dependent methyltransferase
MEKRSGPRFAEWDGHCCICDKDVRFEAAYSWLRDHLICPHCKSIPRERSVMVAIADVAPNWREMAIHESSPSFRGPSELLRRVAARYVPTYFFPGVTTGSVHDGFRCENLEVQTFDDASFDLVITQDVMEHIFEPDRAHREIFRTLKPGGYHILTTPIYADLAASERRASFLPDGTINHFSEPEFHGNPIGDDGSLVTFHYGRDIVDEIAALGFDVELRRYHDRTRGLVGMSNDVLICRKS